MKRRLVLLACLVCARMDAATSATWELSGFSDIAKGKLSGLTLDADGRLRLGRAVEWTASLGQPALWRTAVSLDGTLYAATGHSGKVFRIASNGQSSIVWNAGQGEIFALAVGANGSVYAASSPGGGVYRLINGKAEEVWHSTAKYIWAMEAAPDGGLFIATGEPGRVYRWDGRAKTELYFDSGQANVTALALGPNGRLYAGSDPNGLLYNIDGQGHGTVLYDSNLPEIGAIAVASDGTVYAAAMGGAVASRSPAGTPATTPPPGTPAVAVNPTVITVTSAKESPAADEQAIRSADASKTAISSASTLPPSASTGVTELSGVEKSAIYRIRPSGAVENLRSSKLDNVYDLRLDGDTLYFSTDDHGRIYGLANGRTSLLAEAESGETTSLGLRNGHLYAGVSTPARVISFGEEGAQSGIYESQVHDCTSVARWGHLQWSGGLPGGFSFRTRTGSSTRPDSTWSPWSASVTGNSGSTLIASPPGRYVQFRAEWQAHANGDLYSVTVPFLAQNGSPMVRSISVSAVVGTNANRSPVAAAPSAAYSVTVTDTGEAPAANASTAATQQVARLQTTQAQISWQADDPDSDKLSYSVYFRPEEATTWQLIRSRMVENTLLLDADVFADGRYLFRVVATDLPSNPPEFAQRAELVSAPVLIDSTPPAVVVSQPKIVNGTVDVEVTAHDDVSSLRLCEYSLDAGVWQPIESTDGITDSPSGHFHLHLENLKPVEHLLVFRVYDMANNAGLGKVILR